MLCLKFFHNSVDVLLPLPLLQLHRTSTMTLMSAFLLSRTCGTTKDTAPQIMETVVCTHAVLRSNQVLQAAACLI